MQPLFDPALTPEAFARLFRGYGRERDKELNRLFPEHYAPRSWFSAAAADKRAALDPRTKRSFAKLPPEEQAALVRSFEDNVLLADEANHLIHRANAAGRRESGRQRRSANVGPATPQGGRLLGAHSTPAPEALSLFSVKTRQVVATAWNLVPHAQGAAHFEVSTGMEGRETARGKSDLHVCKHVEAKPGGLDLAAEELRIRRMEARLADIRAKGKNDRELARTIRAARHNLAEQAYTHRHAGFMHRLEDFANHAGRAQRSSRGKAAAEKVRNDKPRTR